ncbi:MAG TPA: guanosine-3',5'-bis(diphosphate) 3'-diphosphatase, partial [Gammaproteobacteria bacterium]|nr:guanosine-3',5'-bis(diphosphate) 3'-diphosphatase [Gammaproteobacteria bacterium]
YVFTPHGKIIVLPRGSTPVDFAYAVHTDIGNTCVAAKINRHYVPLQTQLRNGNTIEIVTDKNAIPSPAWLHFIATAKARSSIRHHLKHLQRRKARKLGKGLLDKALQEYKLKLKTLPPERLENLLSELQLNSAEELYEDVGLGNRMAPLVARQLAPLIDDADGEAIGHRNRGVRPIGIKSNESIVLHLAKCCRPIPGDRIQGIATAGRGIVIHRPDCQNISAFHNKPEHLIDVQWDPESDNRFQTKIRVDSINRRGVLATLAASIAESDSNIDHVDMDDRDGNTSSLYFLISVRDTRHLDDVLHKIRNVEFVLYATRIDG